MDKEDEDAPRLKSVYGKYFRSVGCHEGSELAPREKKKRQTEQCEEISDETEATLVNDESVDHDTSEMSTESESSDFDSSPSSGPSSMEEDEDGCSDSEPEMPDSPGSPIRGGVPDHCREADLAYFWLLVTLDYSRHDEGVVREEMIASAIAGNGYIRCSSADVFRLRTKLLSKYRVKCVFKCACTGHNLDLPSETSPCPDCDYEGLSHNLQRGSITERMRILTCSIRQQLTSIMDGIFPRIREHHRMLHRRLYTMSLDASDNKGPAFLSSMETEDEFESCSITIQMVINGDGCQVPNNLSGGVWAFYLSIWDLPARLRRSPEMTIFGGLIGYGVGNRIDTEIIDMLTTEIHGQVHGLSNNTIKYRDERGDLWACKFEVTAQVHDAEGQCKINGVPNWGRRESGCQFCYANEAPPQARYIGPTRYAGVSGTMRTIQSTRNDAITSSNGYSRYAVMHRVLSPCHSFVDILHSVDLGLMKDIEIAMRAGDVQGTSAYPQLRLPRRTRLQLNYQSGVLLLPTYYPVRFQPFISGSKTARETRLSVLVSVVAALMEMPFLPWGNLTEDRVAEKHVASLYLSLVILNLRRLMDRRVDRDTLNSISAIQRELGIYQEECIGRRTYKFHVVNAHLPQQLISVGNLCDSDTASYEHMHQYLKRSVSGFNKGTFEGVALQRALLRFEVAESCKRLAETTTSVQFAMYMQNRGKGRMAFGTRNVGCVSVPPHSELFTDDRRLQRLTGCTRFFRSVVYERMLLSSHDPILGKAPPAKTVQNLVSVCVNQTVHFGELIVIGASNDERLKLLVQCFVVDNPLSTLSGYVDNVTHPQLVRLSNDFSPLAARYIARLCNGSYDLIVPIESLFAQVVKVALNGSTYLISLPSRIY